MRPLTPASRAIDGFTRDAVVGMLRDIDQKGSSELHFKAPSPPLYRAGGALRPLSNRPLTRQDVMDVAQVVAGLAERELPAAHLSDAELAFGIPQIGRFRAQLYRQRGLLSILIRRVQAQPPTLAEVGAPSALRSDLGQPGLTILAGKRAVSWLHAAVDEYNKNTTGFVVLAERPLAWLHRDDKAAIAHREVGLDVPDFAIAIESGRSLGADLVAIGDVPDLKTAEAALVAAEGGAGMLVALPAPEGALAREWFLRSFIGQARDDAAARFDRVLVRIWHCAEVEK